MELTEFIPSPRKRHSPNQQQLSGSTDFGAFKYLEERRWHHHSESVRFEGKEFQQVCHSEGRNADRPKLHVGREQ